MNAELRQFFAAQYALPGNQRCFECGALDNSWASPTFGIYLCHTCSGVHRSLGSHVSFVRSCLMDVWRPEHLERMRLTGGNALLEAFLKQEVGANWRERWKNLPLGERYQHPAAVRFRDQLGDALDRQRQCSATATNGGIDQERKAGAAALQPHLSGSSSTSACSSSSEQPQPSVLKEHAGSTRHLVVQQGEGQGEDPRAQPGQPPPGKAAAGAPGGSAPDIWSDKLWGMWDDEFWESTA